MKNVRLNGRAMQQILNSPEVRKELERRAEKVADAANENAPKGETGELSQSHKVVSDTSSGAKGAWPRARARVVSNKAYAAKVEAATGYFTSALDAGA